MIQKRFLAGKQIEPPRFETRREIRVLLPVRRETRESIRLQPRLRNAHFRIVETGSRQRIERKRRPRSDHDHTPRHPLLAH